MPIAAVPDYLGEDFKTASPGMRFGMYLKLWGINEQSRHALWTTSDIIYRVRGENREKRELKQENKVQAINGACSLSQDDIKLMRSLIEREETQALTLPHCFTFPALSIAPFATGLGNEHPLENGFAFLWPYGLPYLPGSGIKGVLRQAARELLSGEWGENSWTELDAIESDLPLGKDPGKQAISILFGVESEDHQTEHVRGVLTFWDVIPGIKGNRLMVEIMTPHQAHYYQQGEAPHDSGQPTPISFLSVPPGSSFTFHVQCDALRLQRMAPSLVQAVQWENLLQAAFQHAFDWLGFGAKTAVGYGALQEDAREKKRLEDVSRKRQEGREKEQQLAEDVKGLPEDAAWLKKQGIDEEGKENERLLKTLEEFIADRNEISEQAVRIYHGLMEAHWKGIMNTPDATQGKKAKPKYKPRPVALAKWLIGRR